MIKEYSLQIQAFGRNEQEAAERAIEMLNQGASFDEVTYLYESPRQPVITTDRPS
jgi:hypothetical protein